MPKRILQGTVVSDKNAKTIVVKVERRFIHPVMGKTVRRSNVRCMRCRDLDCSKTIPVIYCRVDNVSDNTICASTELRVVRLAAA